MTEAQRAHLRQITIHYLMSRGFKPDAATTHADRHAALAAVAWPGESIPPTMLTEDTYAMPAGGWTCFHCGETFTTPGSARDHFGADPLRDAACRIKAGEERGLVMKIREMEKELDDYRSESYPASKAYYAQQAENARRVTRAEEEGYAKGLRDGRRERSATAARVRHRKRGSTYGVAFEDVEIQTSRPIVEGDIITVYVADADGKPWGRLTSEFTDGRFEPIDTPGAA